MQLILLLYLNVNSKNAVKFARETCEILFYRAALLRLGKVRELVQEINDQHVGTRFIIKRQPAVRYSSTIYFYFFVIILQSSTSSWWMFYMMYQNDNNLRDLQSFTMYALRYGRYVWIGPSEVFTCAIRVNLERSKQKIFRNAIMIQPKIVLNPITDFAPNH